MKKIISILLVASMAFSMVSCAQTDKTPQQSNNEQGTFTYADTIAWDGEYDVIVAGFGGAGAVAAKTAADNGAKVLLLEKAAEGHEGGNTRYCGQMFAYGNHDFDSTYKYYQALKGDHNVPDAYVKKIAEGVATMTDTLAERFGADKSQFMESELIIPLGMSPEYPEFPGGDKMDLMSTHDAISDGALWRLLRQNVTDRADKIDVWFESPATSLIQDPQSKAVIGVVTERGGETLKMRALNGVVLATGGFENNPEMIETYLGFTKSGYAGGGYNTGDGVKMAMDVGADLWHMEVYEGAGEGLAAFESDRSLFSIGSSGSVILVGGDGNRYRREDESLRHGHYYHAGVWLNPQYPAKSFFVMDKTKYDQVAESAKDDIAQKLKDSTITGDTIEALAQNAGMNPEILTKTINDFNTYVKNGEDIKFGRDLESMTSIGEGPYYAIEVIPRILNTQGGPRRNENAEVLDKDGNPIPHLYSAGELGGFTALQYQGGTNIAECIIMGETSGENAAKVKNALPVYTVKKVESELKYKPGTMTDISSEAEEVTTADNEYIGVGTGGMGGDITVKVTMDGDKIDKIEVVSHNESEGISDPAINELPKAMIDVQSTDVETVSGATVTSKALIAAVNDALSKVK